MSRQVFDKQKLQCLEGIDLSKKGSVDAPIQPLVQYINDQPNYFTTSSCSGRIMIVENMDKNGLKKKGCKWIFSSHDKVSLEELRPKLDEIESDAVFKFEPFVLHVQCRSLPHAQEMMSCGITSGYRNSGISLSSKGKCIVAIRSTHTLEVPLSQAGRLLVSEEYLSYLVTVANQKMEDNFSLTTRFFSTLKTHMEAASRQQEEEEQKHKTVQKQTKKISQKQSRISSKKQAHVESSTESAKVTRCKNDSGVDTVEENMDYICDLFGDNT